jgi:hypothetical protein
MRFTRSYVREGLIRSQNYVADGRKPEVRVSESLQFFEGPTVDSSHKPRRRETIRPRDSPAERGGPVAVRGDLGGARTRDHRIKSEMLY